MSPGHIIVAMVLSFAMVLGEKSTNRIIRELEQCVPHEEVDGCSIPFNSSFPYRKVFKSACNRHDVCYRCGDHYQWSRNDCDVGFLYDMYYACAIHRIKHDRVTRRSVLGNGGKGGVKKEVKQSGGKAKEGTVHEGPSKKENVKRGEKSKGVDTNGDGSLVKHDTAVTSVVSDTKKEAARESKAGFQKELIKVKREEEDEEKELEKASRETNMQKIGGDNGSEKKEAKQKSGERELSSGELETTSGGIRSGHKKKEEESSKEKSTMLSKKSLLHRHHKHKAKPHALQKGQSNMTSSCNGKANCHSEKGNSIKEHTTDSHAYSSNKIEQISHKYHEIEKLLGELNTLIRTEVDLVENRTATTTENVEKFKDGKAMVEIETSSIGGSETTHRHHKGSMQGHNATGTKPEKINNGKAGKKVITKQHGGAHGKGSHKKHNEKSSKTRKEEDMPLHGNEMEISEQEIERRITDSNSVIPKNFRKEMSKDLMANEDGVLPSRNSAFVKCKLAAYLYFVAVRGFGQKFYRKKSPDWCKYGCGKLHERPELKKSHRRPRDTGSLWTWA